MEYILILYIYGGVFSKDSAAVTSVTFNSQQSCLEAGRASVKLTEDNNKKASWYCTKK